MGSGRWWRDGDGGVVAVTILTEKVVFPLNIVLIIVIQYIILIFVELIKMK